MIKSPAEQVQEKDKASRLRYFDLVVAYCKQDWKLIDKQDVDFYRIKYQYSRNVDDFKKTNKGLLCLFEHKESAKRLVVANMQLYHGKLMDYVRQAQALYFIE